MNKTNRTVILALLGAAVAAVLVVKTLTPSATDILGDLGSGPRLPLLLEFGAGKCTACKMMEPVLEELRTTYSEYICIKYIDVRQNPKASRHYAIRVIPAQVFCDADGRELFRHEGFLSAEDIVAAWRKLGVSLPETPAQ